MKRIRWYLAIAALPVLLSSSAAHAQWFNPRTAAVNTAFTGSPVTPYWGWGAGYGSSPGAQYLSGVSQIIRAQGEYNESTSRAYINYEEARKSYISNRRQWQQAYFALREQNEARRLRKLEAAKPSPEAIAFAARSSVPAPLSHDAYDPSSGRLQWPKILQRQEFDAPRERLNQLYEVHAATDGVETDIASIRQAADEMIAILRSEIFDLPVDEYIAARKFLDSVAYSVRAT